MYLLDTDVVSESRKIRAGKADKNVASWADSVDAVHLYLSAITVPELEIGVLRPSVAIRRRVRYFGHG